MQEAHDGLRAGRRPGQVAPPPPPPPPLAAAAPPGTAQAPQQDSCASEQPSSSLGAFHGTSGAVELPSPSSQAAGIELPPAGSPSLGPQAGRPGAAAGVPALQEAAGQAQGQQDGEEQRCSHCSSRHTSGHWRRHPTSGQRLCGACRRYADGHGGHLPPSSVLQQRPAQPRRLGTKEEIAQRRCLQCGSDSPGSSKWMHWLRHTVTGEEWLCKACWTRVQRSFEQQEKQQQQQQQQPDKEVKRCSHCGSRHTSDHWRRHPTSGQRLCGACRTYADGHGGQLPPSSVLQQRPAQPRRLGTKEERAQRRCLQCGSASPGSAKQHWNCHPATGEGWLCGLCGCRMRRQLQQHHPAQAQQESRQAAQPQQEQHQEVQPAALLQQLSQHKVRLAQRQQQQQQQQAEQQQPAQRAAQQQQAEQPAPQQAAQQSQHVAQDRAPQAAALRMLAASAEGGASADASSGAAQQTAADRRRRHLQPRQPAPSAEQGPGAADGIADAAGRKRSRVEAAAAVPRPTALTPSSLTKRQQPSSAGTAVSAHCCGHCGSSRSTDTWRRHSSGKLLCHACADYAYRRDGQLPSDSLLELRRQRAPGAIAQRRCLQCGTDRCADSKRSLWRVHPDAAGEWLCRRCHRRCKQLKQQQQQEAVADAQQQLPQPSAAGRPAAGAQGSRQAPASQPRQHSSKRKRQPGLVGPTSGGKRARAPQQHQPPATPVAPQTAAKRRRKQAQPQRHVAPESPPQPAAQQQQRWPTLLGLAAGEPAGSQGPATASLHGTLPAVKHEAAADGGEATSLRELLSQQRQQQQAPQQAQQAAAQREQQPSHQAEAAEELLQLLQEAIDEAAAAASGLTPELVAAFAMLLPLPSSGQEALLRRLLQRGQFSAAAVQMRMAVHLAGFALPDPA